MKKEFNKLNFPNTLFIDCVASYFYSIYESISDDKSKDDILFYLCDCVVKYEKINLKEIEKMYGDNPWGYQPVKLYTDTNEELFNMKAYEEFCDFLTEKFNLCIDNKKIEDSSKIISSINNDLECDKRIIVFINEKYIPYSTRFFNKKENYHGLLIKKVNTDKKMYTVIDTEYSSEKEVSFEDMFNAIKNCSSEYVAVDCSKYKYNINIDELISTKMKFIPRIDVILELIDDIKEKCAEENEVDYEYFFKGYRFSVLFKIIPYVKMRHHLLNKSENIDDKILSQSNKILGMWENLSLIMLKQTLSSDFTFEIIIKSLEDIYSEESKFLNKMRC